MNAIDQQLSLYRRARLRTAELLFTTNKDDQLSRFVDIGLIVLITLNILAVVLESVKSVHQNAGEFFYAFEVFSVTVFSLEYIARVWSVIDNPWQPDLTHPISGRIKYMFTWMALIDLLAIAPFYLSFFAADDLRVLRALRLLRIFKLTRYSSAMTLLFQVFREESRTIGAAMFVSMLLVFVASTLAFVVENEAQPDKFSSIPAAMYWAVITMTTVGFGDIVPITPWGKVLGAFIGIVGLAMVALPAGILASGFDNALHRRRTMLQERVQDAMKDGVISPQEEQELEKLIRHLNLNTVDANAIIYAVKHQQAQEKNDCCPHCGKPLHQPPDPNVST
ncbi:ion transporter [Magnetovibrio sp.]|uniref:ion transporter n=1 Tax=Magnetovibrio sp. TaxID=2024836 RepID=UPI002F95B2AE